MNRTDARYDMEAASIHADQEIEILRQELVQARRELRFLNQTMSESLSTIAHELRSPLQEIDLYAGFIQEDADPALSAGSAEDLAKIRRTCSYGMDLIEKLMDFSRIDRESDDRAVISFASLTRQVFARIMEKEPGRRVELVLDPLPDVCGDSFLFEQLVRNLLSNSVKYTREVSSAVIHVSAIPEQYHVCFVFSDNGVGFDTDLSDNVFGLFERAHNESDYEGHGIGLATVKKIALHYGGEVSIKSAPGRGCEVRIRFPLDMIVNPGHSAEVLDRKEGRILIGVQLTSDEVYRCCFQTRRAAYELAVEEINRSGGILGRKADLVFWDFGSDIRLASRQAWDLVENEKVDVLMGGLLSSAREEIRRVADKTHTPYFFNSLYEGGVADHYTFFTSIVPEQGIFPALDYLIPRYGTRCYILVADYNYGILNAERLKRYLSLQGLTPVALEYFFTEKSVFDVTISNILQTPPDIIIMICAGKYQNEFHRQWHEKGLRSIPVFASIGVPISGLHRTFPAPTMENNYFMCSYQEDMDTEPAAAFTQAMKDRTGGMYIDMDSESAYTAVHLYKNAVELAGTTETEAVIRALESGRIHFNGPGGNVIVRGEDHHVIRDVALYRTSANHNNELIAMYPSIYSDYVEQVLRTETGAVHGLASLGRKAPNTQYNPMYHT